jgi:hypothetical protein
MTVFWITFFVAGSIRLLWWILKRSAAAPRRATTIPATAPNVSVRVPPRVLLECSTCGAPNVARSAVCAYCKHNLTVA